METIMSNQFKHSEASYIDTTVDGRDALGNPVYLDTEVHYTYLFNAFEFGVKPQTLEEFFSDGFEF